MKLEPVITGGSGYDTALARYHGLSCFSFLISWGSRPRLYARARFAGSTSLLHNRERLMNGKEFGPFTTR